MDINITLTEKDSQATVSRVAAMLLSFAGGDGPKLLVSDEAGSVTKVDYEKAELCAQQGPPMTKEEAEQVADSAMPSEEPANEETEDLSVVRGKNAEKLRDELQKIATSGEPYDTDWWERQHGRLPKKHQDAIREATLEPRTEAIAEQTKEADAAPPESVPEEGDAPLTLGDLKSYGESMVYDHDDQAMQIAISSRLRTVLNEGFGVKKFADVAEEDIPACYAKLKEIRAEFYEDAE